MACRCALPDGMVKVPDFSGVKQFGGRPLWKVDEQTHTVYGLSTAELPDCDREVADYNDSATNYTAWGDETAARTRNAGQDVSFGNIRYQHSSQIAGKVLRIDLMPEKKEIWLLTQPVDDEIWRQLVQGFLTGYSHAGRYAYRRCFECGYDLPAGNYCPQCHKDVLARYAPILSEVSYVDRGCLPQATFAYVKADGQTELRKFAQRSDNDMSLKEHFMKSAAHHKAVAKSHGRLADHNRQLGKAAESRADFASGKLHKAIADEHAAIAAAHNEHAGHLSEVAASGITGEGQVIEGNGLERVAKGGDVEDAFWRAVYGDSMKDLPAAKSNPSGGLFE